MSHDYITVVQAPEPCNKRVWVDAEGNLHKERASFGSGSAAVIKVENLKHLAQIAAELAKRTDQFWILGYPPQLINEQFRIVTLKQAEAIRGTSERPTEPFKDKEGNWCVTRTKELFQQSSVVLFDYDPAEDMPPELQSLEPQEWLERMNDVMPHIRESGCLFTPSTSSRILRDGTPAFDSRGFHAYVMVEDANDVERLRQDGIIKALDTPHGYLRNWGEYKRGASIFDPAVFSPERQDFCGSPDVGEGLELAPFSPQLFEGPRLDTRALSISDAAAVRVQTLTGYKIRQGKAESSKRLAHYFEEASLKQDQVLEGESGTFTVKDFWLSDDTKARVQAFTRPESESFAAFVAKDSSGVPFYFDVGGNIKLRIASNEVRAFQYTLAMTRVATLAVEEVREKWTTWTDELSRTQADEVRRAVSARTGMGLQPLTGELRDYQREKRSEKRKKAKDRREIYDSSVGKHIFNDYHDSDLDKWVPVLRKCLTENPGSEQLFSYANTIVAVRIEQPKTAEQVFKKKRLGDDYPNQPKIVPYTAATLRPRILEVATFFSPPDSNGDCKVLPVPHALLTAVLEDGRTGEPLAGLCEAPMITPDGTVITQQGYDPDTAHFVMYPPNLNQAIPEGEVTKEDVQKAINFLRLEVLADFPFKTDLDRDAVIAFILLALQRRFMKAAPGCLVTATAQSSGKSTLVSLIFRIAFGRGAPACPFTEDSDEMRKLLTAALLEGNSGLNFDNLHHGSRFDSDELATVLTEGMLRGRILGKSETAEMPASVLICATGNNVQPVGDMISRMVPIRLESESDTPDTEEKGREDIAGWLEAYRPECLAACFSILLNYHQHKRTGQKVQLSAPSRFPEWDELVRRPMVLAGLADPAELFEVNRVADPIAEERVAFLCGWYDVYGSGWVTLNEVCKTLEAGQPLKYNWDSRISTNATQFEQALSEAGSELLSGLEKLTPKRLGNNLRYFSGRWFPGAGDHAEALLRLVQKESNSKSVKKQWRVERRMADPRQQIFGGQRNATDETLTPNTESLNPTGNSRPPNGTDENATQCNRVQQDETQIPF